MSDATKQLLDWGSVGTAAGVFFKLLPDLAALLSVIWLALRIWESDTVKGWRGKKEE